MATNLADQFGERGQLGSLGEEVVKTWFKETGYWVIPCSLIDNGGAPLLEGAIKKFILPDIIASKAGDSVLVDIKTKSHSDPSRVNRRDETGCGYRHFQNYQEVARITGMRAALAFIHADRSPPEILLGFLDEIAADPDDYHVVYSSSHREEMIYFNIDFDKGTKFRRFHGKEDFAFAKLQEIKVPPKPKFRNPGPRDYRNGDRWLSFHFNADGSPK